MNKAEWMYVIASADNSPSNHNTEINDDDQRHYKQKATTTSEMPTGKSVFVDIVTGILYLVPPSAWDNIKGVCCFYETFPSIINYDGKETMAQFFLDTGCTKSMTLKRFTQQKQQIKLLNKSSVKYKSYGSSFKFLMIASISVKMMGQHWYWMEYFAHYCYCLLLFVANFGLIINFCAFICIKTCPTLPSNTRYNFSCQDLNQLYFCYLLNLEDNTHIDA